ncbi:cellulase family glycosylhydrolase [Candidatus Micrarchaeota archaeon]|nr:cellulase family glycosylhydrolase [Candidatus Micrarchaeota archaeon]
MEHLTLSYMKRFFLLGMLGILLLAGCLETATKNQNGSNEDANIIVPQPNLTVPVNTQNITTNVTQGSILRNFPDKFSLWTNGTQVRGAHIYQRRVYVEIDGTEFMGNGPLGPPLTQYDFDDLAKAGANVVVLDHPGIFDEKPPYAFNKSVQDNLDKLITMAERADLFVVIAIRTGPGRSEFSILREGAGRWFDKSYLNEEIWKEKGAQDAYVAMWKSTAAHYHNSPVIVGYDLMVEPNSNAVLNIYDPNDFYPKFENTTYDWNALQNKISKAIREVDGSTPIIVGGNGYSSVGWLPYLKPSGDSRTVYAVHQYEPQEGYTHQDSDKFGKFPNAYPGRFDINGDGKITDFDKKWIDNLLGTIDSYKIKYGVPVTVSEYGVLRYEPGADRFLDDEMMLFDERGMNYAIWDWSSSYKPVTKQDNGFNFRFGSDQNNKQDTESAQYNVIKKYWKKNNLRPSNLK